ncbi:hypothetical protein [Nocardia sp. NPDC004711]
MKLSDLAAHGPELGVVPRRRGLGRKGFAAAYQRLRVLHQLTHEGTGLGEFGVLGHCARIERGYTHRQGRHPGAAIAPWTVNLEFANPHPGGAVFIMSRVF